MKRQPTVSMNQSERIRSALSKVEALRQTKLQFPELSIMVANLKTFQSRRFSGTYADLAADSRFSAAIRFFLQELYGDQDFTIRDSQFFRVAGTLERLLPRQAAETATMLAELHLLSEALDYDMARVSLSVGLDKEDVRHATKQYVEAWRLVGRREDRLMQLQMVLSLGRSLVRLTNVQGLRLLLRMMRVPANAAGLGSLQHFLEAGFDTFSSMNAGEGLATYFLSTIEKRESELIRLLFEGALSDCEAKLAQDLATRVAKAQ